MMAEWMETLSENASILIRLCLMLLAAFGFSRVTKRLRLPNVTGYILSGIVIGPHMLGWVDAGTVRSMSFITDAALALIAFGTGQYFKWDTLKKSGRDIILLTTLESLAAAFVVTAVMLAVFRLPLAFSLLLGAIASATAPASTLMTIRQYNAKGEFINTLLQVVALDDAVALLAFSGCAAAAQLLDEGGSLSLSGIVLPLVYNLLALGTGALAAILLELLLKWVKTPYNRLLCVLILLLGLSGLCAALDVSPLLACMLFGTLHTNLAKEPLFDAVDQFSPPVLTLFFVISGMRLNLVALTQVGIIGVTYFLVRIAGKYAGAYLGARCTNRIAPIRRYLGLALIPQAGVAIGLAAMGERLLPGETGEMLSTIILSSSVLYEIFGPVSARLALKLAGVIQPGNQPIKTAEPDTPECVVPGSLFRPISEKPAVNRKSAVPEKPLPAGLFNDPASDDVTVFRPAPYRNKNI